MIVCTALIFLCFTGFATELEQKRRRVEIPEKLLQLPDGTKVFKAYHLKKSPSGTKKYCVVANFAGSELFSQMRNNCELILLAKFNVITYLPCLLMQAFMNFSPPEQDVINGVNRVLAIPISVASVVSFIHASRALHRLEKTLLDDGWQSVVREPWLCCRARGKAVPAELQNIFATLSCPQAEVSHRLAQQKNQELFWKIVTISSDDLA